MFLDLLDRRMDATRLLYVRLMDDWLVLVPKRWTFRRVTRIVNQTVSQLELKKRPEKTYFCRHPHPGAA